MEIKVVDLRPHRVLHVEAGEGPRPHARHPLGGFSGGGFGAHCLLDLLGLAAVASVNQIEKPFL